MIQSSTHIINRQILDLQLPSKHNAFETQTAFRELFVQKLLPILSNYFDDVIPKNITLKVDLLEVDLGEIDFSNIDDYSVNVIADRMKTALDKQLHKKGQIAGSTTLSAPQRNIDLLLFFLQYGHLPWWQKHLDFQPFEEELMTSLKTSSAAIHTELKTFLKQAFYAHKQESKILQRLIWQFSDRFMSSLLANVFTIPQPKPTHLSNAKEREIYWMLEIENILSNTKKGTKPQVDAELLKKPVNIPSKQATTLTEENDQRSKSLVQPTDVTAAAKPDLTTSAAQEIPHNPQKDTTPSEAAAKPPTQKPGRHAPDSAKQAIVDTSLIATHAKETETDGYYIHNSGLVLIAPYLGHFFTALKLMKQQAFMDEAAQIRAMHLLQYLATFEEEAPEYELTLNKLLCGIALEQPVLKSVRLTDEEKQEARQLLEAVIRNWSALKNTSPEGLQEGFLRRAGKLTPKKTSGNWLLQVEGKAHDILLGKLPWTYSMIKQSWMPGMLTVEWL